MKRVDKIANGRRGFSLIELSIVLIIIGILSAAIVTAYSTHLKRQTIVTTKDNLAATYEAVETFRGANGYYPCPASGTDPSMAATDCAAAAPAGTRTVTSPAGQAVRIGVIPLSARDKDGKITQLLHGEQAVDGFKNRLAYAVVEAMATTEANYDAAGDGSIVIKNSNDMGGAPFNETARFIVFSHGPDGVGAYTTSGALRAPCNIAAIDGENCNDDAIFADNGVGARSSAGGPNNFDDFIASATNTKKQQHDNTIVAVILLQNRNMIGLQEISYKSGMFYGAGHSNVHTFDTPNETCAIMYGDVSCSSCSLQVSTVYDTYGWEADGSLYNTLKTPPIQDFLPSFNNPLPFVRCTVRCGEGTPTMTMAGALRQYSCIRSEGPNEVEVILNPAISVTYETDPGDPGF